MRLKKIKIKDKIIYTVKVNYQGKETEDAHYKFIKKKPIS